MENYIVVLFKDKKRKKIIKKFVTYGNAKKFYDNLLQKSEEVIFNVEYENGKQTKYELGLIELSPKQDFPVYLKDELGRNVKIKLDESNMVLISISPYRKEELIFDIQKNKKINVGDFLKTYLSNDGMKLVSILNNKILVQKDDKLWIFSLKSESDASRFLDDLGLYLIKKKRGDCLLCKDYSSSQRKYLFKLLKEKGIDIKKFYRKFTTHPRQE